jgi:NADH dehydrogenase FAD-containing subunit
MLSKLAKAILFLRLVAYSLSLLLDNFKRNRALRRVESTDTKRVAPPSTGNDDKVTSQPRNIVIVGASFAGYHVARLIASSIPIDGSWNIVIIEPSQHYQFTWTLPRFCVIEGHEEKTFIPYGPYLPERARGIIRWVHHHASVISKTAISIRETGEDIPYEYLIIATGSGTGLRLPSRVGAQDKKTGSELLREMQQNIKGAERLVVIGGGAAGVELAADAKERYPEKNVTLVHSRNGVMHRFGSELQAEALKGLQDLGVVVMLGERAFRNADEPGILTLQSGSKLEFDFCVRS